MWVFNVFLLLLYSFCNPMYDELVRYGAQWYVWIPTVENPAPTGPPPEFVPGPAACPTNGPRPSPRRGK